MSVGKAYNSWTKSGLLEFYWGEHIHAGYYRHKSDDFKKAKIELIYQALNKFKIKNCKNILDVGCGIGGTCRILSKKFPTANIIGISISQEQIARAKELSKNYPNVSFKYADALKLPFKKNYFDLVWSCECGAHIKNKKQYVNELKRVSSDKIILMDWCLSDTLKPANNTEKKLVKRVQKQWQHAKFASVKEYKKLFGGNCKDEIWTQETKQSWIQAIQQGIINPLPVLLRPKTWFGVIRDIHGLWVLHRCFELKLVDFGVIYWKR